MVSKPHLPNLPGCRNPHEGENPLKTLLRILKKNNPKKKTSIREILEDKVQY